MERNKEIPLENSPSRRKFVWGMGILSAFAAAATAIGVPFFGKKKPEPGKATVKKSTIKMLTQDGRLVEVDEALLSASRKKVTNIELQNWIKK